AIVMSVSDATLLRKACGEYRSIFNDALAKLHQVFPDKVPDFQIPEAESKKIPDGTAYYYPLPQELGLDQQITPTSGLSETVAALTISQTPAERLLKETPLKVEGGPLADLQKPMASAAYCHWEALMKVISPWVDYGGQAGMKAKGGDDDDPGATQ